VEVIGRGFSTTTRVELGMGAIGRLPRAIEDLELPRRVLLIAQPETWEAASAPVQAALRAAGMKSQVHITTADSVNDEAAADIELVLRDNPLLVPAAIGSGTVNDLVKMAAQEARVPYISVATAASMNGYPSPISAVLKDGLKSTVPAAPPVLIVADTTVLAAAPYELAGSGYADLLAKPCSVADWILARDVAGEEFDPEPLEIMGGVVEPVIEAGHGVAVGDTAATETLMAGLLLSGLSMAAAGTSQPASGAEHLVSHFWDMIGHRDGWELDLHGRQVGIGCILMSALWERLLRLEADDLVPAEGCDAGSLEVDMRDVYGPLSEPCLREIRGKSPAPDAVGARLRRARELWPELKRLLADTVVPARQMRADLAAGGAPLRLEQIGRSPNQARLALRWARTLRNRYTCLDLAAETGHLDGWIDELVAEVS
jgi:glycerol-1-phosphate dehydrogenase [NAD(P)+]